MTKVFIGGSRAVSRLTGVVREKLDDLIRRGCTILIGDANGSDKAVQQHLATRGYRDVVVYCMDECRNNVGGWPANRISMPGARKDFAYYVTKDLAMAQDATCGVMLWDGKSKGTLNNIQRLIGAGKKTLVFLTREKTFHKLTSEQELHELLERCSQARIQTSQRKISSAIPAASQLPLHVPHT